MEVNSTRGSIYKVAVKDKRRMRTYAVAVIPSFLGSGPSSRAHFESAV